MEAYAVEEAGPPAVRRRLDGAQHASAIDRRHIGQVEMPGQPAGQHPALDLIDRMVGQLSRLRWRGVGHVHHFWEAGDLVLVHRMDLQLAEAAAERDMDVGRGADFRK